MKRSAKLEISDVFWAYMQPGLVVSNTSTWMRFDEEFVRVLNEQGITGQSLAKKIGVKWSVLNSGSSRDKNPEWMTPLVLSGMAAHGLDIGYILNESRVVPIKPDEAALLDNYRNATPAGRASLREVGTAFAQQAAEMSKTSQGGE